MDRSKIETKVHLEAYDIWLVWLGDEYDALDSFEARPVALPWSNKVVEMTELRIELAILGMGFILLCWT